MHPFTSFFLKFKSNLLVKILYLVKCFLFHGNPGFNCTCTSYFVCKYAKQIVLYIYHSVYWAWLT